MDKVKETIWMVLFYTLYAFIIGFVLIVFYKIDLKEHPEGISALLIGASALLASTTVMIFISNANNLEKEKHKKELNEKSLEAYGKVASLYTFIEYEGGINNKKIFDFYSDIQKTMYLLDHDIVIYIQSLYKECVEQSKITKDLEQLELSTSKEELSLKEKLTTLQSTFNKLCINKRENLDDVFKEYLRTK